MPEVAEIRQCDGVMDRIASDFRSAARRLDQKRFDIKRRLESV
jgi:hypothetical protein